MEVCIDDSKSMICDIDHEKSFVSYTKFVFTWFYSKFLVTHSFNRDLISDFVISVFKPWDIFFHYFHSFFIGKRHPISFVISPCSDFSLSSRNFQLVCNPVSTITSCTISNRLSGWTNVRFI